jgi:hypothetical protein
VLARFRETREALAEAIAQAAVAEEVGADKAVSAVAG